MNWGESEHGNQISDSHLAKTFLLNRRGETMKKPQNGADLKNDEKEFTTPFGAVTSLEKQANCIHDWQPDGQTLTAVRWTCNKCFKTELR